MFGTLAQKGPINLRSRRHHVPVKAWLFRAIIALDDSAALFYPSLRGDSHALERSEEALASFDAALKQKSKFAEAHNNRGAVLSALGRDAEAIGCFHKALALKADYADAHYNLGSSLRVLGRYDEALTSLDRALALQPNLVKALNNRGAVMTKVVTGNNVAASCGINVPR